jgi:transcriptional regulator with XRE-family HTH domain
MPRSRKSPSEALVLGADLRSRRRCLRLVLQEVAEATGVDVGQLSRFESGRFRQISPNLQKFLDFLKLREAEVGQPEELVSRFARLLLRSRHHEIAARALVDALERFDS